MSLQKIPTSHFSVYVHTSPFGLRGGTATLLFHGFGDFAVDVTFFDVFALFPLFFALTNP